MLLDSAEAIETGLPVQRPPFLHHEDDRSTYAIQDADLYAADLVVAPVWQANEEERTVYLPKGRRWVHIWSGAVREGGRGLTVPAPLAQPAVFSCEAVAQAELFAGIGAI